MSQAETEEMLSLAKQVTNRAENGRLVQKATRFMTHMEKTEKQQELDRVRETLSPSNIAIGSLTQEGRANLNRYKQNLEQVLRENVAPVGLSASTRDDLIRAERALAEKIAQGMLPAEQMRRNPPGSVGAHIKWERENKPDILAWKNLRRLNNPDDDSEDVANVETLRPRGVLPGEAQPYNSNAQIAGHFAMTPLAKANWPENMPPYGEVNSPMKQMETRDREIEELKAQLDALKVQVAQQKKYTEAVVDTQAQLLENKTVRYASKAKIAAGDIEKARWQEYRDAKARGETPELPGPVWTCEKCGEEMSKRLRGGHTMAHWQKDKKAARDKEA